jgi:hypothetical protein
MGEEQRRWLLAEVERKIGEEWGQLSNVLKRRRRGALARAARECPVRHGSGDGKRGYDARVAH